MRRKQTIQYSIVLCLALLSSGCSFFNRNAPLAAENKTISAEKRHQQIQAMQNWQVSGAIGITVNNKTDMASFTWTQQGNRYEFQTFGPLNIAGIRIAGRPGNVVLYKNANQRIFAHTPEKLMQRELGWSLPLQNIHYWGRGIAAPGVDAKAQYDAFGHITTLQQQGWTIQYLRYQGVEGMDLPRTVVIQHRNLRIKIAFKRWSVNKR